MNFFFVRWLVALMVAPGLCYAQAQPAAMQKAVSSLIQQKAIQRGFAANDPRIKQTLVAGGASLAGYAAAAAAVTAAGVTAPAWVTVAVVAGLGTLFSAGITLAVEGLMKWYFNADGSISVQVTPSTSSPDLSQPVMPKDAEKAAACTQSNITNWCDSNGASFPGCLPPGAPNPTNYCRPGLSPDGRYTTEFSQAMQWAGYTYKSKETDGAKETKSASDAINALSDSQKAEPLNPAILATIADQAWKHASSQPGYEGLPYDTANPISPSDASSYQASNPTTYPTVGDAVAPQPSPAGSTSPSPWALPAPSTGTTPGDGSSPSNPQQPPLDWSIPATGDVVPTTGIPVSYTPTLFAAPPGCPAPVSFSMFGKPYAISYAPFCDLMATLAPLFLACGAAAAALIFAESLKS